MTEKFYRIRDWDKHFENNKSRIVKDVKYVLMPNKMDGDGYTQLVDHKNGAAHLGAWHAIVSVASKCHPRGTLVRDDGTAQTPESLSRMSRIPARLILEVIPRLVAIGWLEVTDSVEDGTLVPDCGTEVPQQGQRREWNRRELNRRESLPPGERGRPRPGAGDRPAGTEEILKLWDVEKLKGDPNHFFKHYQRKGWRGDWKALARTWSERETTFSKPSRLPVEVMVGKGNPADAHDDLEGAAKMHELWAKHKAEGLKFNELIVAVDRDFAEWDRSRRQADLPSGNLQEQKG